MEKYDYYTKVMNDTECGMNKHKIVKRLEYCAENKCKLCQEENGSGFPWIDGRCYGFTERLYDAIALLRAQEPVSALVFNGCSSHWYRCGKCKMQINKLDKYCKHCGQAVEWDG